MKDKDSRLAIRPQEKKQVLFFTSKNNSTPSASNLKSDHSSMKEIPMQDNMSALPPRIGSHRFSMKVSPVMPQSLQVIRKSYSKELPSPLGDPKTVKNSTKESFTISQNHLVEQQNVVISSSGYAKKILNLIMVNHSYIECFKNIERVSGN